ncbi:MAG: stage V sporulation protein T [Eubacteriales bacterium]
MKATGIVRRIDDLGRVVIPKEIRRTLRIREGEPLEIFTDREGEVILKKYSPIGEITVFAKQYAESLSHASTRTVMITDRDQFVAISGGCKNLIGKSITKELENILDNREQVIAVKGEKKYVDVCELLPNEYSQQVISPIICEGDVIGAVILLAEESKSKMGEVEQKLALAASGFLGRQMEQ